MSLDNVEALCGRHFFKSIYRYDSRYTFPFTSVFREGSELNWSAANWHQKLWLFIPRQILWSLNLSSFGVFTYSSFERVICKNMVVMATLYATFIQNTVVFISLIELRLLQILNSNLATNCIVSQEARFSSDYFCRCFILCMDVLQDA